jgi:hypothetical protein
MKKKQNIPQSHLPSIKIKVWDPVSRVKKAPDPGSEH